LMVPVSDPFRVRVAAIPGLAPDQVDAVVRLQSMGLPRIVQPHATLEDENEAPQALFVIRRGWVFSSKLLPNGGRQVIDFRVAGDLVGSCGAFLKVAQQSSEAVTETVLTEIPIEAARRSARHTPALLEALAALLACERVEVAERLVDLGRRDSVARVARLLLDLWRRLFAVGMATPSGYACPLSQYLIADATGLTAIHVNRVLRELRENGLVTFRHGYVKFHDFDRLAQLSGFETRTVRGRTVSRSVEEQGAA
jgi:CRP-like cAMP-binding protein